MKPTLRKAKALKTIPPVRPNVGTEMQYRRALDKMIRQMNDSVVYWLSASYKKNEPVIAQDELPATALRRAVRKLARQWQHNFNRASEELAAYFVQEMGDRSDAQLQQILNRGGFTVKFKSTRAMNDVMRATINENVGLIKSIPQKYFAEIEGAVMRSIAAGRDLAPLTAFLQKQYGVTRNRAALIARDQNNKATGMMNRVRQLDLGIVEAEWAHSGGGRKPRPTHVAAGARRQRYDVAKGWFDPAVGRFIFPGELVSCRCVSRSIIPGFN